VDVIHLRAAVLEDERRLAFLDRATWSVANSPVPLWDGSTDFFASDPVENVIVAELDGTPVGYVKLRAVHEYGADRAVLSISGIAVDPGHQRQGIGDRLIGEVIEEAGRRGATRLVLHVLSTNSAAIDLYASNGFSVSTVRSDAFFLGGRSVDDLVMERSLVDDQLRNLPRKAG